MLFNLSQQRHFPHTQWVRTAIFCHSDYGPCFDGGGVGSELGAPNEPFNGDNKCLSYANKPGYKIPLKDGKNMLTGSRDGDFTITELEVWEV
jgi:hypothetical protein